MSLASVKVRYRCEHEETFHLEKLAGDTYYTLQELATLLCPACAVDTFYATFDDMQRLRLGRHWHYYSQFHSPSIFTQAQRRIHT